MGGDFTENCSRLLDILYGASWFNLSPAIQKHFIFMMGNASRQVAFDASYFVLLNLESFAKVGWFKEFWFETKIIVDPFMITFLKHLRPRF